MYTVFNVTKGSFTSNIIYGVKFINTALSFLSTWQMLLIIRAFIRYLL